MILEEETFKKFGYYPKETKNKSNKQIVVTCDKCGRIREVRWYQYRKICKSCIQNGKGNSFYGKHHSEKTKKKQSRNKQGENNFFYNKHFYGEDNAFFGKHHTKKTKEKIRKTQQNMSEETKQKMSKSHIGIQRGKNNPNWKGGVSFEPYCIKFDDDFKERVREYWNRRCILCNKDEIENGRRLNVHHVTYNKNACCDNSVPLFVALCIKCHSKTNFNRNYWQNEFKRIIYSKSIDGKCFYTKTEMEKYMNEKNNKNV